jgi:hypothetical protein
MNGTNDYLALLRQVRELVDNHVSHVGVEARDGLVAEQDLRIGEDLGGEREAALLSARNALGIVHPADFYVPTLVQIELK